MRRLPQRAVTRAVASALAVALLAGAADAARLGGAFLDTGLGARALGLGGAQVALADGADAVFYNPAGLAAARGRRLLASYQPMSLDRSVTALAGMMNLRGDLAFGLAWMHAGVDGLQSRTGAGERAGAIDLGDNAVLFGLGLRLDDRLQVGASVKIVDHRIDVPQVGASTASGRGVDLGLRYDLGPRTTVAVAVRNLMDKLSWTVRQPAAQSRTSEQALPAAVVVGVAHHLPPLGAVALDVERADGPDGGRLLVHAGARWRLNELLTLRGGVHRIGDPDFGLPAFGLTVRPMRIETLQVHYAWVADELDAGGRSLLTVSGRFP